MAYGKIIKVSGPLVVAEGIPGIKMSDVVKVGSLGLIGEVIELKGETASIQVYEETGGLGVGDPVYGMGEPLSVELGPGLLTSIYDGIQRPLNIIKEKVGPYITRGIEIPAIDKNKSWEFKPEVKVGTRVSGGDIIGTVQETKIIIHKIMVPFPISGEVIEIKEGSFKASQTIARVSDGKNIHDINMIQRWPVRKRRSLAKKIPSTEPLITGQRIIDAFFPVAKGGTATIPGPFGAGKTVMQHALAKWSDADIVIFVGCGERGNEMTDVLFEFPRLKDPKTGEPLMQKAVLIANTSNMPISAREASVYTGATIAEYFRDMGYNVALMADSTSRWAEALREMSGRLEEMPGEEGYPAYLGARVSDFYERAGRGLCIGTPERQGSLSIIGSVSPPGGDFSEPVVQNTLRAVKVFWGLDDKLAFRRHFPAINWLTSYSLYTESLKDYYSKEVSPDFNTLREEMIKVLQEEAELEEIVRLVGMEALSERERLVLLISKMIREDFLYQNAFDEIDAHTTLPKQFRILKLIDIFYKKSLDLLKDGTKIESISKMKIIEWIARVRFMEAEEFNLVEKELDEEFLSLRGVK